MMTPQEKYLTDSYYHTLVDMLYNMIMKCQFTPSELREATILASIKYETENCRPINLHHLNDMEKALNIIDKFKNSNNK